MVDVPVVIPVYKRQSHLLRTLASLRENDVKYLHIYSDGPKSDADFQAVEDVRKVVRAIDWCEVRLIERRENFGLGRAILAAVQDTLSISSRCIVCEDDLEVSSGAYQFICEALEEYSDQSAVMSVTGWTHPRVIPARSGPVPYFDGRAESLFWGTWRRAWDGMDRSAVDLLEACLTRGIDPHRFGADVPDMARREWSSNIWAVRWLLLHQLKSGLCLRPPFSLVRHIGYDNTATNASDGSGWEDDDVRSAENICRDWPAAILDPQCEHLWQVALPKVQQTILVPQSQNPATRRPASFSYLSPGAKRILKALIPPVLTDLIRAAIKQG